MKGALFATAGLLLTILVRPALAVEFSLLAEGLTAPVELVDPADGSGRLFVAQQDGIVRVIGGDGKLDATPLLDLRPRLLELRQDFEERGLLGLALHPDFASNGRLYVSYSAPLRAGAPSGWNQTRRISELTLAEGSSSIDIGSERPLIELDWPSRKHNGGGLAFGPDGYLYIGLGDGGGAHGVGPETLWSAFDVPANELYWDRLAQDRESLFGSILRIDVDGGFPGYAIPPDNPLVGKPGRDEIYAIGFRNPYRIAFDSSGRGEFLVTAIAETLWESIYMVAKPGNFGWPIREATHCVDRTKPRDPPADCPDRGPGGWPIEEPIVEYPNMQIMHPDTAIKGTGVGTAVVGGRIYRGSDIPELRGKLVFGDWSAEFEKPSGQIFVATPPSAWGDLWPFELLARMETRVVSVAEDAKGELFVLTHDDFGPFGTSGKVWALRP